MEIKISAKTHDGVAKAEAIFTGEKTIVLAGGKIRNRIADSVSGGTFEKKYIDDPQFVSDSGVILADCEFYSPSTAAVFVTGNASNGYRVWKTDDGKTLDEYLKDKGLR